MDLSSISYRVFGGCVSAVFLLYASPAKADTVEWVIADRPTSYILEGPDKGRGAVDELYSLLHKNLKEYEHKKTNMTFGRVTQTMKGGQNLCAVGFKDPEREEVAYFSIPAIISLTFSVVAENGHLEKIFGNVDSLSIGELLARKDLRGGILQKRSYGEIDPLIKEYENNNYLHTLPPDSDIVQVLLQQRIDYIIEIMSFAKYRAKQVGKESSITSFMIKEYKKPVLVAHVFCTKNEWGRQFIDKINQVIRKNRASTEYLEFMGRWYDQRSRKMIKNYYDETFLKSE